LAVSTEQSDVRAVLLRFVGGPGARDDRRIEAEILERHLDVKFPGRVQETVVGSYAALPLSEPLPDEFSIHCWVMPTMPQSDAVQTVWSLGAIALEVVNGNPCA